MYFYVDESGQTGLNLFDQSQPVLYYGVLRSSFDLDDLAEKDLTPLRKKLEVNRLHAAEIGVERLASISNELKDIKDKYDLGFDIYLVNKKDHALISFFDQVFDQGLNPAVPWTAYWTPLRYVLLGKVSLLFDDEILERAWHARKHKNNKEAEDILKQICQDLIKRINRVPDARSREIIFDGLSWVIKNTEKIGYNIDSKKEGLNISPNLVGFQSVLHGISSYLGSTCSTAAKIIVDRQSQFNTAQRDITEFYQKNRHISWASGPFMPKIDYKHMPVVPITCTAGTESAGLEIVDIFIWIFKRHLEEKYLDQQLTSLLGEISHTGFFSEISIPAIIERWTNFFEKMPEQSQSSIERANIIWQSHEKFRKKHL